MGKKQHFKLSLAETAKDAKKTFQIQKLSAYFAASARNEKMIIKICGITSPETATACFELGADMVGLVHFPPSSRHLDLPELASITHAIAPFRKSGKQIVLLVVDKIEQKILRILDVCDHQFDFVQFYGEETEVRRLENHVRVLRPVRDEVTCHRLLAQSDTAFHPNDEPQFVVELAPGLYPGGNGRCWNWPDAAPFCRRFPTLLAGGITPENVAEAIRLVQPLGIDVSSGVESVPGMKDIDKVKRLIENVRQAVIFGDNNDENHTT